MSLRSSFAILFFFLSFVLTNTNSQYRIIGGSDWNIRDSLYLVSISYNNKYKCVGSLITIWRVVTAAHCVIDFKVIYITAVAGVSDLHDIHQIGQTRTALRIRYPPNFNLKTLDMDIALIKVSVPFYECDTVKTIELCRTTLNTGTAMRVSGWGLTAPCNEDTSFILQSAVLYILEKYKCVDRYALAGISLPESMICSGNKGADTCTGGSGAPGVVNGRLCAVVSAGTSPYNSLYPTLYTSIDNENVRAFLNSAVRN